MDRDCRTAVQALHAVDFVSGDIHKAPFDLFADRHGDRCPRTDNLHTAVKSVGRVHCDAADGILTYMLLHLNYEVATVRAANRHCVVDRREILLPDTRLERNVDNRADNL